jgi:hypothetical protein
MNLLTDRDDVDALVATLKKTTLVVSVGLRNDYLLVSIAPSTAAVARLGHGPSLRERPELAPLAKFDGKPVLTMNDPGKTWVSLKRISDNTIEETDSRDGQVVDIYRMTVSADGKFMTVVDNDVREGTTSQYTMRKQP